jgi:hypothetical protein
MAREMLRDQVVGSKITNVTKSPERFPGDDNLILQLDNGGAIVIKAASGISMDGSYAYPIVSFVENHHG